MAEPITPAGTTPPPTGRERRVWIRHPGTPEAPSYCVSEQEDIISWKARIRDLSRGGVSLMLRSSFEPDSVIDIMFPSTASNPSGKISARVVRSEPQDDVNWVVGCAFLTMLSDSELKELLEATAE